MRMMGSMLHIVARTSLPRGRAGQGGKVGKRCGGSMAVRDGEDGSGDALI